jgi:hypothetical protein
VSDPGEPEDTVPFTHRPYGNDRADDNPFVSPSGPAAQPSGPSFGEPLPPPPPSVAPVPYGPPAGQEPWQAAWAPVYGAPVPGSLDHKGATTALVLGIVSVASLVLALFCCITIPGVFCAPFAWAIGAKAKREIEAFPGRYRNLGSAVTGMWMGIVMTVIGALSIASLVALIAWIGYTDWSLV